MNIPFVDLKAQYFSIKDDVDNAISQVVSETSFIGGTFVKKFEQEFSNHNKVKHCISCANGTDSIEILLKAYGIGKGAEVIVPAISWISTSEAVSAVGAVPVFVDVDPDHYTIDATRIEEKITGATKAIIPVHLYGHPADMPAILKVAEKRKLLIIEDCAQSHDAEINSVKVGLWGQSASFSFFPGKNLGAYGDAGCMTTQDDTIAETARMIANHGQLRKHEHMIEGRNSRLDSIQAAILSAKLPHLNAWTEARIRNAAKYDALLAGSSIVLPRVKKNFKHVFHLYVVRVKKREEVLAYLLQNGIHAAVHYPKALPFLTAYNHFHHTLTDFPVASIYQDEVLSLPLFPEISNQQIEYVAKHLLKVTRNTDA